MASMPAKSMPGRRPSSRLRSRYSLSPLRPGAKVVGQLHPDPGNLVYDNVQRFSFERTAFFVWRRGSADRSARFPQLGSAPVNEKRVGLTRSHPSPWPERSARRSQWTRATRQHRYNDCGYGMDLAIWALYFWRHLKYRADPAPLQVGCDFRLSGSVRQRRDPSVADDLRSNFYAWLAGIVGCSCRPIQSGTLSDAPRFRRTRLPLRGLVQRPLQTPNARIDISMYG